MVQTDQWQNKSRWQINAKHAADLSRETKWAVRPCGPLCCQMFFLENQICSFDVPFPLISFFLLWDQQENGFILAWQTCFSPKKIIFQLGHLGLSCCTIMCCCAQFLCFTPFVTCEFPLSQGTKESECFRELNSCCFTFSADKCNMAWLCGVHLIQAASMFPPFTAFLGIWWNNHKNKIQLGHNPHGPRFATKCHTCQFLL